MNRCTVAYVEPGLASYHVKLRGGGNAKVKAYSARHAESVAKTIGTVIPNSAKRA